MRTTPGAGAKQLACSPCHPAAKPGGSLITGGSLVCAGTPAEHVAIHRFLLHVFHQPSAGEFQAQLDEPAYEPTDRLLIKHGAQLVAHLRLIYREMRFDRLTLPTTWLADLATLPEYRGRGCASALLAAAEQRLRDEGTVLALLRTDQPRFYARRGWVLCGRPGSSVASPQRILSHLREQQPRDHEPWEPARRPLHIRYWRHVERAALQRLYRDGTRPASGPSLRSDAYWLWLIARRAWDRIYVAIEGSPRVELDDTLLPIVGYAFMKRGRLVELMTSPRRPDAAEKLLARACADALENGLREVRLDAFPGHPLHDTLAAACAAVPRGRGTGSAGTRHPGTTRARPTRARATRAQPTRARPM